MVFELLVLSVEGFTEMVERKVFTSKYDGDYLHKKIKNITGEKRLHETLTNVVIPSFDIKRLQPVIFSTLKVCLCQSSITSIYYHDLHN